MRRPLPDVLRCPWPPGSIEPPAPTEDALARAVAILAEGGLVAIPTETVYGLAANALDADAVARIFTAKGRPAGNPLIVHVSGVEMARSLAASWPDSAARLTEALWPGPVTVVVPARSAIPPAVTAGGPTVALRCPAQHLARRLIERLGRPLAAPSANRSERLSPTTAGHVLEGLGNRVDLILDGGPCGRGIESTVVDCTTSPPRILRPGPVGAAELSAVLGGPIEAHAPGAPSQTAAPARSPGGQARHYAPATPLEVTSRAAERVEALVQAGAAVAWLTLRSDDPAVRAIAASPLVVVVPMPASPHDYAARLYATLHALDRRSPERIVVDAPPDTEEWRAVNDRLARASAPAVDARGR